jgi:opacity protein-like surface antigen
MMSGALGYRYNYFRTELEYVWRDKVKNNFVEDGDTTKQNFKTYSYMLNGYFDLAPYHWITPYIGAGIGYTKMKYSSVETLSGGEYAGALGVHP